MHFRNSGTPNDVAVACCDGPRVGILALPYVGCLFEHTCRTVWTKTKELGAYGIFPMIIFRMILSWGLEYHNDGGEHASEHVAYGIAYIENGNTHREHVDFRSLCTGSPTGPYIYR